MAGWLSARNAVEAVKETQIERYEFRSHQNPKTVYKKETMS